MRLLLHDHRISCFLDKFHFRLDLVFWIYNLSWSYFQIPGAGVGTGAGTGEGAGTGLGTGAGTGAGTGDGEGLGEEPLQKK